MWLKNVRYLDYNAGSGLSHLVREKLISLLKDEAEGGLFWANPSSRHRLGQRINQQIYQARTQIAKSLAANPTSTDSHGKISPDDLYFTSSGTEANQVVIRSAVVGLGSESQLESQAQGAIIGITEHSASMDMLPLLDHTLPFVRVLPVLPSGQYDLNALEILLAEAASEGIERMFLSLAWANNETGVILNIAALKEVLARSPMPVLLHLDGSQVWGKLPLNVKATGADYVTFSAHKIGAPAGTGVIWKNPAAPFTPLIMGGTENSLGIILTGFAAQSLTPAKFAKHTSVLRSRLETRLREKELPIKIWGEESDRIGNTSRIGMVGFKKYENWVDLLDLRGFAVSHASACKSQVIEPSRVLQAMGANKADAINSIRVSFGMENTIEDVDQFSDTLQAIVQFKKTHHEGRL